MKKLILSTMAILCAGVALADPVEGVWKTTPNDKGGYAYVQIAPCGDKMCGTVVKAFDSAGLVNGQSHNLPAFCLVFLKEGLQ